MDWLVATGSLCLGIIAGCLVAYFVEEAPEMNKRVLYGASGIFSGGAVIALFHLLGGSSGALREYWMYPIGLLIGFIAGSIYEFFYPPDKRPVARGHRELK